MCIHTQLGENWCTPSHLVAVLDTPDSYVWKRAKDLTEDDYMLFTSGITKGVETNLPKCNEDTSNKTEPIIIPELDNDISWFLGYFQGDGNVYRNTVTISVNSTHTKTVEKVISQLERFSVTVKEKQDKGCTRVVVYNKNLAEYLLNFKKPWSELDIPQCILESHENIRGNYLAGLYDADGTARQIHRLTVLLTSTAPKFLSQLQSLYSSLGIPVRHKFIRNAKNEHQKDTYELHVVGKYSKDLWKSLVGIYSLKYTPNEYSKHTRYIEDYHFPRHWFESVNATPSGTKIKSNVLSIDEYKERYGNYPEFIPIKVLDTSFPGKVSETFDLSVENQHEYFCDDGTLGHNSAEIALGAVGDDDFINLKNFEINPERGDIAWMSNNSLVLKANGDFTDFRCIPEMARRIRDNGEPGMINLHNIQKYGRLGKECPDNAILVNPCVTEDTWVFTSLGSFQVKDLIQRPFLAFVDGKEYNCNTGFFPTGTKQVFEIDTTEGFRIQATEDHKFMTNNGDWVELRDLTEGDQLKIHDHTSRNFAINKLSTDFAEGWLIGSLYGDGTFQYNTDGPSRAYLCYWGDNRSEMADLAISRMDMIGCRRKSESWSGTDYKDKTTISNNNLFLIASQYIGKGKVLLDNVEKKSLDFQAAFLRGWFDADGTVSGTKEKGYSVRLASCELESLFRAQRMALRLGVYGKVYQNRRDEHDKMMPDGHDGLKQYHCRSQHEFIITRSSMKVFYEKIGFDEKNKMSKLSDILSSYKRPLYGVRFSATVKSITPIGQKEVYDCTVEQVHAFDGNGFYAHNCGEIPLENMETCNLAEVFPPRCADMESMKRALEYATLYASTVSLLPTHRPETNAVIARNRRIGVSISGIAQWASGAVPSGWGPMNYTQLGEHLRNAYKVVKSTNVELAKQAGVPASIRVTTVKPSGSISLLAGATPGVHYPVSRYAIRRVRIGETSPLVQPLIDAGVPHEKDMFSQNTYVFEFVIDHGNVRPCEEVSPWEQFSLVQMLQKHYSDNCVSATIYFDKERDGPDVEKMLAMYIPTLKSVSMLPVNKGVYAQAPYEHITKEEYEKRLSEFQYPKYETVKGNVPVGSKYCSGDTCEL